jgi:hypothetical protein
MTASLPALGDREPRDTCVQTSPETPIRGVRSANQPRKSASNLGATTPELSQGGLHRSPPACFFRSRRQQLSYAQTIGWHVFWEPFPYLR